MAYNKRIRGDSHQSNNEEFSHNRITVILGGSGVIAVCFAILLISAAIGWMMLRQGSLLAFLIVASFLALFAGAGIVGTCFIVVRISDALREVRINRILSSTIISGEVVSHYDPGEQEWTHLSSIHEQGKVLPQLPMKAEQQEPLPSEAYTVVDMHKHGISFKKIAEATQWTEYKVRQLCNQIDGKTP